MIINMLLNIFDDFQHNHSPLEFSALYSEFEAHHKKVKEPCSKGLHRQNVCPFTQLLYLEPTEIHSKMQNQKIVKTGELHHTPNNKDYLLNSKQ